MNILENILIYINTVYTIIKSLKVLTRNTGPEIIEFIYLS